MVEKSRISNGDEPRHPVDNSQYVHDAVESLAQATKIFLDLAQPVQKNNYWYDLYPLCSRKKKQRTVVR